MRFREYAAYRPPQPRTSVVFDDHHRWLRDDKVCDILGDDPAAPRACLYGEIRTGGITDAFLLVVADDGKLEYRVERGAGSVEVDRDLALIAAHALERLVDDPRGRLAGGIFRAAVWAATISPARTRTSGLEWAVTFDDADGHPAAPGLAGLLPRDRHLTRALARMLASPVDLAARRDFDDATDVAAARADRPVTRLDPATVLTPAGVTAALTGTEPGPDRLAVITGLAVTGVWPPDGGPDRAGAPVVRWHDLDWDRLL
ncbi:hypothetical protein GCM10010172_05700 [Paractinoplanes ferrugineus]|uniref:Uncharacterized protein n=1 Tax=Paractinoplanes ferrugineus TaxID=113564 RepID=A0A919ME87_9ACTN|nr:hypothetical protein [Actinoplanes ferrugineus]GIE12513.1 hypothetical protein Afe05nite_43530 [Actinoplanes ferrugineus]